MKASLIVLTIVFTAAAQDTGPLAGLSTLSDASSKRISSWDRTGGNHDSIPIKAGQTVTLAEIDGPGAIKHIWATISSSSRFHLRELVLRMYWDGERDPSVEAPIGDFFGDGFGEYHNWHSLPLTVQGKALNCYFEMPFSKKAVITVTNDGAQDVRSFYYHVDYQKYPGARAVEGQGRFHALWHREHPTVVQTGDVNLTGKDNYVFVDAQGRGQFVGVVLSVQGYATGWWGEGDDMFFIDGERFPPSIHGTGLEDYFNNGWGFQEEFNYPFIGYSLKGNGDWTGQNTMYRFHIPDPIYFKKSLRATIEHGHANHRADDYSSTAYWYQTEPHKPFPPLPPVIARMPDQHWKIEVLPENLPN
ncbi:MAG: glycoside hydrolase family 172 protein [Bryobacteraceae bacterium]